MPYHFVSELVITEATAAAYWFVFVEDQLLLYNAQEVAALPFGDNSPAKALRQHYLGKLNNAPVYAVEAAAPAALPAAQWVGLRQSHDVLGDTLFNIASRAHQILTWDRNHQFCGRCGAPLQLKADERAKQCLVCHLLVFPRISPCVIVLIHRGNELLLARSPHFRPGIYSALAGFVEPGESAEEAVVREVREEVKIEIKNLNYVTSQSWPFPDSFMLGFIAEYASGEIQRDPKEIEDAQWFSISALPPLPAAMSIARKLINKFL